MHFDQHHARTPACGPSLTYVRPYTRPVGRAAARGGLAPQAAAARAAGAVRDVCVGLHLQLDSRDQDDAADRRGTLFISVVSP